MGLFNNVGRYSDIHEYIKNFKEQTQSGLKLDVNSNYDIEGKRLANVGQGVDADDAVVMHQMTSLDTGLETKLAQLKADSLQVDGSSHMTGDLDLRGQKLINPGEIEMNRKLITNLDTDENNDLSAVNMVTLKKFSSSSSPSTSGDIDLQEKFNVKNSKQQNFSHLSANYDNLVSFSDVKNIFLSRKETFAMQTDLDMGNHQIYNVKDPTVDDQGVNKKYVDAEVNKIDQKTVSNRTEINRVETDVKVLEGKTLALSGGTMTGDLDMGTKNIKNLGNPKSSTDAVSVSFLQIFLVNYLNTGGGTMSGQIDMGGNKIIGLTFPTAKTDATTKEYVDRKFISPSGSMKNVFQYIMNDVNETSSEFGITVLGIVDFPQSPHLLNKKAIKFQMGLQTNDSTRYYSRLGLDFYKLPEGDYTLVVEFFHPTNTNIELNCLSTTINVNHQIAGSTGKAWKNIVQLSKNVTTKPEYLMVDMKCAVDQDSSNNVGWLIVWGVSGFHSDVPSSVYDQPFVFETGKMVMETDLDLNGKRLLNYNPKSKAVIFGDYKKETATKSATFTINGETAYHVFGFSLTIKKITLHVTIRDGPIVPANTRIHLQILKAGKEQRAFGVYLDNNAISYSFDFAVDATEEFQLSLENRGGIARANATILVEI